MRRLRPIKTSFETQAECVDSFDHIDRLKESKFLGHSKIPMSKEQKDFQANRSVRQGLFRWNAEGDVLAVTGRAGAGDESPPRRYMKNNVREEYNGATGTVTLKCTIISPMCKIISGALFSPPSPCIALCYSFFMREIINIVVVWG